MSKLQDCGATLTNASYSVEQKIGTSTVCSARAASLPNSVRLKSLAWCLMPLLTLVMGLGGSKVIAADRAIHVAVSRSHDVLWTEPRDLSSRNLYYGPAWRERRPKGPVTFLSENLKGSNPKLNVVDQRGDKWRVKLGVEARPETTATRLLWAVGYFVDEDYFMSELQVKNLPAHLHRGQDFARSGNRLRNVQLERLINKEDILGKWQWKKNPFRETRELNGLRVMMALMNNWDLKNQNNSIYSNSSYPSQKIYLVSDLGATFGTTGFSWTQEKSKGNVKSYSHSKFIRRVTGDYVDFNVPTRPVWIRCLSVPTMISRMRMRSIGSQIPRADARWIGSLLARLSSEQIRDAFRAGGYSEEEVEDFATTVEQRIEELKKL